MAMKDVELAEPGKLDGDAEVVVRVVEIELLLIALVVIGCFGYIIAAQFTNNGNDTAIAWTTLGSTIGYLLGNGVGARRGQETVAPFAPAAPKDDTP